MKINIRKIFLYVSMFLVLLYPFNSSISNVIYKNNIICISSVILGMIGIVLFQGKNKISKNSILILGVTLLVMIMTLMNNYYLKNGQELRVAFYVLYLILPFLVSRSEDVLEAFCKVIPIFFIEHIIATYIGVLFKDFYVNNIIPIICNGRSLCVASGNVFHGYIPGVTSHFSTNAIYLSIASLFIYAKYLTKQKRVNLLFFVIAIVALFVAGKRAHLIFTILCCLFMYLYNKRSGKIYNRIIKMMFGGVLAIICLMILSKFIPEILNVVNRFQSLIDNGDVLNGRDKLYNLAFSLWDRHLIFGNGWGAFSHYYQLTLYSYGEVSYIDAHNVFIQLLCEVGIIGFLFIVGIMLIILFKSFKLIKNDSFNNIYNSIVLKFCFMYQIFFILYCFTGNPLYDPQCYVIYFMTIGFIIYLENKMKEANSV